MDLSLIRDLELSAILTRFLGVLGVTYGAWKYIEAKRSPLNAFPTIGYSGVLASYVTAVKWLINATVLLQEGYDKYHGRPFKVATISGWVVILNSTQHVDDVRNAPDDVLSIQAAVMERMQSRYTLGGTFDDDAYHIEAVRSLLTRNLASRFDELRDEIVECFKEYIPITDEWRSIPAYDTLMHIICRTSNRYFVGLPFCREPGYCSLNESFTLDVALSAWILLCCPAFLKPFVGRYLTPVPGSVRRALHYLGPTLEERIAQEKLAGDERDELPNDLISWLLETATQDYHHTAYDLVLRILTINFAAVHTTTMAITQSLFDLAIHGEYVATMREEAEDIIEEFGWTKAAMQRMRKIDSFLKESQRLNCASSMIMTRKTLRDWTLSDGTLIPEGILVGVASDAMNKDERSFPDAGTFKGSRFAEMSDGDGEPGALKHQMVSLEINHVVFGHGRHACPGRFFAVNEIKAIFAHILLNYDVQLENGSMERPTNLPVETAMMPNPRAKVMFRKRQIN